jgi:hypothetical protein
MTHIQVPRILLLFAILLIVIALTLLSGGCADTDPEVNRGTPATGATVKPSFSRQLDWGLYAFEFEGHTYMWEMDGFLLHSVGCKGDHE